jgi:drug/metabolite transporter (DMT)-like permease
MTTKKIIIGSLLCLVASASWGAMFPVAHIALQRIDPYYFSFIRYLVVALILAAALWIKEGKAAFRFEGKGKALTLYGTMAFTVYNMCVFSGQHLMGESGIIVASIMEALMPMITIVILALTGKGRPPGFTIISIALAFIGCILVITRGELSFILSVGSHLVPLLLIFIGVVAWVIYSMGGAKFEHWSILRYSALTCLLGSVVSGIIVALGSLTGILPVPSPQTLFSIRYELSFMIVLPGLLALLCWNTGMKHLTPLNGILFINFVPVTTFVWMAVQGYSISPYEAFGTLLIIYALVSNNIHQRKAALSISVRRLTPAKATSAQSATRTRTNAAH